MSPLTSSDKMLERFPPGQQPHSSTAIAATSLREKARARRKAMRGMRTNWHTSASRTPMGLRMCSPSWLSSTVQPSPSMVKHKTKPTNTLIPWLKGESQKATIRWVGSSEGENGPARSPAGAASVLKLLSTSESGSSVARNPAMEGLSEELTGSSVKFRSCVSAVLGTLLEVSIASPGDWSSPKDPSVSAGVPSLNSPLAAQNHCMTVNRDWGTLGCPARSHREGFGAERASPGAIRAS